MPCRVRRSPVRIRVTLDSMLYVRFSSTRSKRYFSLQQETLGTLDGYVEEMVAGQKVVKVFNREPRNLADFKELNEGLRVAGTTAQTYASTMVPVTVCLTYANYAIVAVVGAILAIGGQTDVGSLASYLVFVRQAAMSTPSASRTLRSRLIVSSVTSNSRARSVTVALFFSRTMSLIFCLRSAAIIPASFS